ncbi:MAG: 30S ribosomal protein S12 methylthiotransferase RimO [Clostridia bacterium]|nr:30S ribosomal protein S12 methylthiotransferase RimO [Clostridia bacterium]
MSKGKVGFVSLGCSKNTCDTEVMLKHLLDAGYEITPEETDADVVIINTCAFIESAKKESIDNILDIAWLKKNRGLRGIVVAGCMAERYREQVLEEFPEVDAALGVGGIHHIVEAVDSILGNNGGTGCRYSYFEGKETSDLGGERVITTGDRMAYMKISEGCNNRCTYCAIPLIRGRFRSRTIEDLVGEAKSLDDLGVKELNLIAQDTTAYGIDLYGRYAIDELIRKICESTKIEWIRLLYCYPDKITDEFVREVRDNPRVVKYIDLPIQHISEKVLRKMNRHGGSSVIREAVKKLRDEIPGVVLRSTAIVGFPGETEEDFEELCEFIKETKFERFGAFTYSREEDTPAYSFTDQIDEQVKQDRYDILMRAQLEVSEKYNESRVGKTYRVFCEGYDTVSGYHWGRSYAEAADIDGKIWFNPKKKGLRIGEGEMIDVLITEAMDYDLIGQAII